MSQTMFERYGGFGTVSKIVMVFYDRVLDSDIMAPYFDGVDMRRLIDHQTKFISQVMGGPASYTDSMLRQVHAHKNIAADAFDEMLGLLSETLEDFEVADEDIEEVLAGMESRRSLIVATDSPPVAAQEGTER